MNLTTNFSISIGTRDNVTALVVWLTWSMEYTSLLRSTPTPLQSMDSNIACSEKEHEKHHTLNMEDKNSS
jgi:hypothetical protein